MKKTEIATIIFVASLSMLATYFLTNTIIGDNSKLTATVKTAEKLPKNPGDVELSKQFFNKDALNPTVEIYVDSNNSSTNTTENSLSSAKPSDADSRDSANAPDPNSN